nr:unnamed protein product [Digitaria exilis]
MPPPGIYRYLQCLSGGVAPRSRRLPVLDLTDRDFTRGQPPARAVATVARCLRVHAEHGAPLDAFRAALVAPSTSDLVGDGGAFGRDVVGWVAAAVARGAREVAVDLMAPPSQDEDASPRDDRGREELCLELASDAFEARNSLEHLALGRISLRAVPLPAAGLAALRSLSLSHALDVTGEAVEGMLANCAALESLTLTGCHLLTSVSAASERLRCLELVRLPRLRLLQRDRRLLRSHRLG